MQGIRGWVNTQAISFQPGAMPDRQSKLNRELARVVLDLEGVTFTVDALKTHPRYAKKTPGPCRPRGWKARMFLEREGGNAGGNSGDYSS